MSDRPINVAVLGSTGSIGRNTLEVIAASNGSLRAVALAAHKNTASLLDQARSSGAKAVAVTDPAAAERQDWSALPKDCELLVGDEGVLRLVKDDGVDIVLSAIVGSAGLRGTWAALEAGKTVALANKESLVVGGPLIIELARQNNAAILPVDSEHSAVFQALQAGRREEVRRVVLTASGGPFRALSSAQLAQVTVADALAHPTWAMGPKITVDSATLMNKALEIIEARWLFDLRADQISVMIHPQSVVHSMVEYMDGSVLAQLSPPDMKLPIQYALTWPHRREGVAEKLDWSRPMELRFEPPDFERFDALRLGLEAAAAGGTAGAALNGANEAAVAEFLAGRLRFQQIVPACRSVLENHNFIPRPSLEQVLATDGWARQEVLRWSYAIGLTVVILLSAFGLGFVIFVHELGHFIVAKLCGVKCEKFYLGFDIAGYKICHFRWGETEYGIGILPLGGYVKMLGQEDNPSRMREEMERAKQAQKTRITVKGRPLQRPVERRTGRMRNRKRPIPNPEPRAPNPEPRSPPGYDPRSYLAQSVPKRMAIISAGVIMNMIFAFFMAVVAFGIGVEQTPCVVGSVISGEAGWKSDLRPGDEILKIAGKKMYQFRDLNTAIQLGDLNVGETRAVADSPAGRRQAVHGEGDARPHAGGVLHRRHRRLHHPADGKSQDVARAEGISRAARLGGRAGETAAAKRR